MWVIMWGWFFIAPKAQNLRRCKQDRGSADGKRNVFRCWSSGANSASVAACEGLCENLMEGAASGDVEETAGRVRPVWTEVSEDVFRGYLQRKNSLGSGTIAAGLGGKSGDFGRPKKVLDEERWSQSAHLPVPLPANTSCWASRQPRAFFLSPVSVRILNARS